MDFPINNNKFARQSYAASFSSPVSNHGIVCPNNSMLGTNNGIRQVGFFPDGIYGNTVPQGISSPYFTSTDQQDLNLLGNSSEMFGQVSSSCNRANLPVTSSYVGLQTNNCHANPTVFSSYARPQPNNFSACLIGHRPYQCPTATSSYARSQPYNFSANSTLTSSYAGPQTSHLCANPTATSSYRPQPNNFSENRTITNSSCARPQTNHFHANLAETSPCARPQPNNFIASPTITSSYARPHTNIFRGKQSVDQQNTIAPELRQNQQLLVMYHHARVCQKKEHCGFKMCAQIKKKFEHVVQCKSETCSKSCLISRRLIKHYMTCNYPLCKLCGPVKESISLRDAKANNRKSNKHASGDSDEPVPKRVRDQHDGMFRDSSTDMKNEHDTKVVSDGESVEKLRAKSVISKEFGCSANEAAKEPQIKSVENVYSFVKNAASEPGVKSEMDEEFAKDNKVNTVKLVVIDDSDNEDGIEPLKQVKDSDLLNHISENGMIVRLPKNEDSCAKYVVEESNRHDSADSDEPKPKRVRSGQHDGMLCDISTAMKNGHDMKVVSDGEFVEELRTKSVISKELGCSVNDAAKMPQIKSVKNVSSFVNNAATKPGIKSEMSEEFAKEDKTVKLVVLDESDNGDEIEPLEQMKGSDHLNSVSEDGMIVDLAKNVDSCAKEAMEKSTNQRVRGVSLLDTFTVEEINVHLGSLRLPEKKTQVTNEQPPLLQVVDQNTCTLCGEKELRFAPQRRYCGMCDMLIASQGAYYCTGETGMKDGEFPSSDPISLCSKCYNASRKLVKLPSGCIPKIYFQKRLNYGETDANWEWWVQCSKCELWQHQVCALFNGSRNQANVEYTCVTCFLKETESGKCKSLVPIKVFGAQDLPRTKLSDHIEKWLFAHLKVERVERAAKSGKNVEEEPGVEGLCVRVVSSIDRVVHVKSNFQELLKDGNYPSQFPYKSKAIVLFQKIEGVDVCLFAMYVQEYGSQCPLPNQRHTYISYIDSVRYFRPEIDSSTGEPLRTFVYHGILVAYLEYCKKRGFTSCSLWVYPPSKNVDYILNCHPESQRMPKPEKLRAWYQAMIGKALEENVVVEPTNLYDYYLKPTNDWKTSVSAAHLPYCENDFWPEVAEDILSNKGKGGTGKKETEPKGRARRAAKRGFMDGKPDEIMFLHELGERMGSFKEDLILIYLQPTCKHCRRAIVSGTRWVCTNCKNFVLCKQCYKEEEELPPMKKHPENLNLKHEFQKVNELALPDTDDPDPCRECKFFDGRLDLLRLCQEKQYQFDTLRRAKHSTMMILHHLNTPACSSCRTALEPDKISWRCSTCPGYYICSSCYSRKIAHDHELVMSCEKATDTGIETRIENAEGSKLTSKQQAKALLEALVHASKCKARCKDENCRKIKLLFKHGLHCQVHQSGGCLKCKQMWRLIGLHCRSCEDLDCKVPRCKDLKDHISKLHCHSSS